MLRRLFGSRARRAYEKGIERYNAGELVAAIEHFDSALATQSDSGSPDASLARFYRGEAHARLAAESLENADARRALAHFDAALTDHPSYPDLHFQRGLALLSLDDALAAEQAARQALERNAEFVEAGALVVLSLLAQGQQHRAQQERERWKSIAARRGHAALALLTCEPFDQAALLAHRAAQRARRRSIERVDGLLHEGFWKDAKEVLDHLLTETPDYPDLRLRMAACASALGDDEGAALQLETALELNPQFADAHVLAGIVSLRRDRVGDARRNFEQAARFGNLSSPVKYGFALCDLRTGEWHEARTQLDALWAGEEFHAEARFLRAALALLDRDLDEAVHQFEDALQSARQPELLLDAAAAGLQAERLSLVRRAVDALGPGATHAAGALVRSALLGAEGSRDRSIDVLEAATAEHPDHPALLWALALGHTARGENEVALRRLSNLEALGVLVPGAQRLAVALHRQQGDLDAALAVFQTPSSGGPTDSETAMEFLFVLRQSGEVDQARELWDRWSRVLPLDLRWRLQDPKRWITPLAPWPTAHVDRS